MSGFRGHRRERPRVRGLFAGMIALAGVAVSVMLAAAPAAAHSYSATVYASVTEPERGVVRTVLDVEYVLLATDGARAMDDAAFEEEAFADVQESGRDPDKLTTAILDRHSETVDGYVLPRFSIAPVGGSTAVACPSAVTSPYEIVSRDGVPHARIVIEADCSDRVPAMPVAYEITTRLFPGTAPGGMTTTIVDYDVRSGSGVANLDTDTHPTMSTTTDWGSRMGEFLVLGAEHLLLGPDHLLFLLALIVGSRRLRDIVLAATAFTVAHSVTFILAALGVVSVPSWLVEPAIALSIAVVAFWELRGVRSARKTGRERGAGAMHSMPATGSVATEPARSGGARTGVALKERATAEAVATQGVPVQRASGIGRDDLVRLAIVFSFGLMHGVGFAGALGIDQPFSWSLLGALLVFNLGIEMAQLLVIAVVFPVFVLLRRRVPSVGLWVAGVVGVMGLFWFVERIIGAG
ncbi:HupE/UreJ family protein [Microbacterium sp. LWH10-1.2]|uniref:HupE/UreJ family protein n=1 Tax=Microbacterium sp. LWH10-1.2 TaxID=3135255 RepID=UPI003139BE7F